MGAEEPRHLRENKIFVHSPKSWESLWKGAFGETAISCKSKLVSLTGKGVEIPAGMSKIEALRVKWGIEHFILWSIEVV